MNIKIVGLLGLVWVNTHGIVHERSNVSLLKKLEVARMRVQGLPFILHFEIMDLAETGIHCADPSVQLAALFAIDDLLTSCVRDLWVLSRNAGADLLRIGCKKACRIVENGIKSSNVNVRARSLMLMLLIVKYRQYDFCEKAVGIAEMGIQDTEEAVRGMAVILMEQLLQAGAPCDTKAFDIANKGIKDNSTSVKYHSERLLKLAETTMIRSDLD